jgi:hypothetical protein
VSDIETFAQTIVAIQLPKEAGVVTWYPFTTMSEFWRREDAGEEDESYGKHARDSDRLL